MKQEDILDKADQLIGSGDVEKAFLLLLEHAENGDVHAMERIALMYSYGEGTDQNDALSIEWDMKAVAAGSIIAARNLAITYRMKGDILKAKTWFEKAIECGDHDAFLDLAKLYMVSEKEDEKVKFLLGEVLKSDVVCEDTMEEANEILNSLAGK